MDKNENLLESLKLFEHFNYIQHYDLRYSFKFNAFHHSLKLESAKLLEESVDVFGFKLTSLGKIILTYNPTNAQLVKLVINIRKFYGN